jgi:hypothetical protein
VGLFVTGCGGEQVSSEGEMFLLVIDSPCLLPTWRMPWRRSRARRCSLRFLP